jgi:hypothetical protein
VGNSFTASLDFRIPSRFLLMGYRRTLGARAPIFFKRRPLLKIMEQLATKQHGLPR